jgi:hypothetical protein
MCVLSGLYCPARSAGRASGNGISFERTSKSSLLEERGPGRRHWARTDSTRTTSGWSPGTTTISPPRRAGTTV